MYAVHKIVFACNAGMASGAMGAARLRQKLRAAGLSHIMVVHCALDEIPPDADMIIAHKALQNRIATAIPGTPVLAISDFLNAPEYGHLIQHLEMNMI
jgi:PTS system mannitol-specific IIC component